MIEYINVRLLLDTPGSAVICHTEEEAKQFIGYMLKIHPDKCPGWNKRNTNFRSSGVAYTFYWKDSDNKWKHDDRLLHSSVQFVVNEGYAVFNLYELMHEEDIEESDASLDILLG